MWAVWLEAALFIFTFPFRWAPRNSFYTELYEEWKAVLMWLRSFNECMKKVHKIQEMVMQSSWYSKPVMKESCLGKVKKITFLEIGVRLCQMWSCEVFGDRIWTRTQQQYCKNVSGVSLCLNFSDGWNGLRSKAVLCASKLSKSETILATFAYLARDKRKFDCG